MLETLLCEQRKGLDVQTLQQEPRLHAFKMSFLGCLSAVKYWCKDSWNAPASFWCWSRMRHDHRMNANGITFWAPRWQRFPLDIYSFFAFNSREKKNKWQDSAQQFQFTNVSHFPAFSGAVRDVYWSRRQPLWEEMEWMWRDERDEKAIMPRCGGRRCLATLGVNKCRWGSRVQY